LACIAKDIGLFVKKRHPHGVSLRGGKFGISSGGVWTQAMVKVSRSQVKVNGWSKALEDVEQGN
jgi:hypothetical protein